MRVAIISSWPPAKCGTADGAELLATNLAAKGVAVARVSCHGRGAVAARRIMAEVRAFNPDVVHHEFPTIHHHRNPLAHLYPFLIRQPTVVTLHEFIRLGTRRRLACLLPRPGAHYVFPTAHEMEAARHFAPFLRSRLHTVPIGSNIPASERPPARLANRVAYFSLLGPRRGIEQFMALARLALNKKPCLEFLIIGEEHYDCEQYLAQLRQSGADLLNLRWCINSTAATVADHLAAASVAYLPYPSGAAENRGTLLACLQNGCIPLTTRGPYTPKALDQAAVYAASTEEALEAISAIAAAPQLQAQLRKSGRAYLRQHDWPNIAARYISVYLAAARRSVAAQAPPQEPASASPS